MFIRTNNSFSELENAPSWGCHCLSNHITFWFWLLKSGNSQTIWVQCIIIRRKITRLLAFPSNILPKSVRINVSVPCFWPRTADAENAKCVKKAERRKRQENNRLEGGQETPSWFSSSFKFFFSFIFFSKDTRHLANIMKALPLSFILCSCSGRASFAAQNNTKATAAQKGKNKLITFHLPAWTPGRMMPFTLPVFLRLLSNSPLHQPPPFTFPSCILFWRARVCRPLLSLCRPSKIFKGCLNLLP